MPRSQYTAPTTNLPYVLRSATTPAGSVGVLFEQATESTHGPFGWVVDVSTVNESVHDDTLFVGFNSPNFSGYKNTQPAIGLSIEADWKIGGLDSSELHLVWTHPDGRTRRMWSAEVFWVSGAVQGSSTTSNWTWYEDDGSTAWMQYASHQLTLKSSVVLLKGTNNQSFLQQANVAGDGVVDVAYVGSDKHIKMGTNSGTGGTSPVEVLGDFYVQGTVKTSVTLDTGNVIVSAGYFQGLGDGNAFGPATGNIRLGNNGFSGRAYVESSGSGSDVDLYLLCKGNGTIKVQSSMVLAAGKNIVADTTTGSSFGTAVGQQVGMHGQWCAQRAGAAQVAVATTASTQTTPYGFSTQAQADAIVALVNELRAALVGKGLIKGAA